MGFFDGNKPFKLKKKVRLISLFSGYDSQLQALKNIGVDVESWRTCEWAVKSIQALKDLHFSDDTTDYSKGLTKQDVIDFLFEKHISMDYNQPMTLEQIKRLGETKQRQIYNNIKATHNLVDINQVKAEDLGIENRDDVSYILTYSFPCQDLSNAGLRKGMEKGSGTRSENVWQVERFLDELRSANLNLPQVLLMENVPDIISKRNIKHFAQWRDKLEKLGYRCYWKILNAKDFGIPQNRGRCFMVSFLGDYYFNFPKTTPLSKKLKDFLEPQVDEKYYLKAKLIETFDKHKERNDKNKCGYGWDPIDISKQSSGGGISKTITTNPIRPQGTFIIE